MNFSYRNWRMRLLIFGGWTLFGLIFAVQGALNNAYFGRPAEFGKTLISWLSCAYLWALLTPFVASLADKFPLERKTIWRNSAIHLTIAVVLSFIQLAIYVAVRQRLPGGTLVSLTSWQWFQYLIISGFHENLLIYAAIIGLAHAGFYYRRFRERERRAAQLELEAAQLETQLARAQIDALKMQLHPHFLFNTLNSISVLMRDGDAEAANRMLVRLSELLRVALKSGNTQEVALKDELEFLRGYLEIEQIRFEDRLTVDFEIEPNTLEAKVPNLILQPLVENAVKHGIAPLAETGRIIIAAHRENGCVELSVSDNGAGFDESLTTGGIGLKNTRERLEKIYGDGQKLELISEKEGGSIVKISIPFHTN